MLTPPCNVHNTSINPDRAELLWLIQTQFSALELGRFIRLGEVGRTDKPCALLDPEKIKSIAFEAAQRDRLGELKSSFQRLTETQHAERKRLISRVDIEALVAKPLPADFPLALRFEGEIELLRRKRVAIVGSRHPTFYGREQAARFAHALAEQGICIISGAAIGIDTVANLVAHSAGSSVAVLGSGLACPYPRSNIPLLRSLATTGRGLILSEFEEHQRAERWNFPKRNRIIAALADFLLVIEARLNSGTLITARLAAEHGVEVGALPGPVHAGTSHGSNLLIKEGAFCIERPEEILERFINLSHQGGGRRENCSNDREFQQRTLSSLF